MQHRKHLLALLLASLACSVQAVDLRNGEDINELCAGCHGEFGQGGKDGEYPRLAGQPASFISKQLHLFRDRKLTNMAMVEYVDERQTPDEDIIDISEYLARMELPTKLSVIDESKPFDPLARLLEAKKVLNIPAAEGDVETGRKTYNKECRSCHGTDGKGDHSKGVPMLSGQYTNYLWRQVEKYRKGIRIHDESAPKDELLAMFTDAELKDIFAFLSVADD